MNLVPPVDTRQPNGAPLSLPCLVVSAVALGLIIAIGLISAQRRLNETIAETVTTAVAHYQPQSAPPPAPPARNITSACREIVLQEAAQYVFANMTKTSSFPDNLALRRHSAKYVPTELKE